MNLTEPYEFDVFVSTIAGTRVYPYIARIIGKHSQYCFQRRFLRFGIPAQNNGILRYPAKLGLPGVYEIGVNRKDMDGKQISHESTFFCLVGPDCFCVDIERGSVLRVVESMTDDTTKEDILALLATSPKKSQACLNSLSQ